MCLVATFLYISHDSCICLLPDNETLPVVVDVVERDWQEAVFANLPEYVMASVPMWIRPDESIITLESRDAPPEGTPGCDIRYMLQTGVFYVLFIQCLADIAIFGLLKVLDICFDIFEITTRTACVGTYRIFRFMYR